MKRKHEKGIRYGVLNGTKTVTIRGTVWEEGKS